MVIYNNKNANAVNNYASNITNKNSTPISNGGGFNNPSNNPVNGTNTVQSNIKESVIPGASHDNKVVGTNTAQQNSANWINGGNPIGKLPDTAPLSENGRRMQEISDSAAAFKAGNFVESYMNMLNENAQKNSPIKTVAGYNIDTNGDLGLQAQAIMRANPVYTPEAGEAIKYIMDLRNAKIANDEGLWKYNNDYVGEQMNSYLQRGALNDAYAKKETNLNDMMTDVDSKVDLLLQRAALERDRQINEATDTAREQRQNLLANAPIVDMRTAEQLSAMGLSRGANASSGYGQSAMLMNQLGVNNQIASNYGQLAKTVADYNNAYSDASLQANLQGLTEKMDIRQLLADLAVDKWEAQRNAYNDDRTFMEDKYKDERDFRENKYQWEQEYARGKYESDRDYELNRDSHNLEVTKHNDSQKISWAELISNERIEQAKISLQARGLDIEEQNNAINRAINEIAAFQYVTPYASYVLGLPEGTVAYEQRRDDADRSAQIQIANINNQPRYYKNSSSSSNVSEVNKPKL